MRFWGRHFPVNPPPLSRWLDVQLVRPWVLPLLFQINRKPWLVSEFCSKGTLKSVLVRERAKLDETFKFSLATDVTSGIEYLHKQDFIHGCLTTANCYVDSKWVVKVADWEYNTLAANQRNRRVFTWSKKGTVEDDVAKIRVWVVVNVEYQSY